MGRFSQGFIIVCVCVCEYAYLAAVVRVFKTGNSVRISCLQSELELAEKVVN